MANAPTSSSNKQQLGVSLIELLISMALGIFFLGVAVQYLATSRESSGVQDSSSRIQENARFALGVLRDDVRIAGYFSNNAGGVNRPPYFFQGDCVMANPCTSDGDPNTGGDILAVGFLSDTWLNTDCLGNALAIVDTSVANIYWVEENDDGVNSLYCRARDMNIPGNAGWLSAAQPLVDGIDQMQVQYGVTNAAGDATHYLSADSVPATDWLNVVSARIALLVDSGIQTAQADRAAEAAFVDGRTYSLLDVVDFDPGDDRLRRVHTTVVSINN